MSEKVSLSGKRVLVTGGTTGIGRGTVKLLASEGARILTFGRHQRALDDALAVTSGLGGEVTGFTADVATEDGVKKAFAEVDARLGGIDILINNAGVGIKPVQDVSDDEWRYGVETDFVGYLACARQALQRMKSQGVGHLVFVGSVSADHKSAGNSTYAAVKAGIATYAETLRKEVAKENIRVTLIEPGLVGADLQGLPVEEQRKKIEAEQMLYAEDLAETIIFALTRANRTDVVSMRTEPRLQGA